MKKLYVLLLLPLVGLTAACSSTIPPEKILNARYQLAVDDARNADPSEIVKTLRSVTTDDPGLIWQGKPGESAVLVSSWIGHSGWDDSAGQEIETRGPVWVTLAPEIQRFCQRYRRWHSPERLVLRLEQLLGLPPNDGKTRFAELWVPIEKLYRPCPDPEITDQECSLEYPQAANYLTIAEAYRTWFEENYTTYETDPPYPWTRLGYTYDWAKVHRPKAKAGREVGLSELVIPGGETVTVRAVVSTEEYCRRPKNSP